MKLHGKSQNSSILKSKCASKLVMHLDWTRLSHVLWSMTFKLASTVQLGTQRPAFLEETKLEVEET